VVRWDSPFVLATAGTFAVHVILLIVADAVAITHPLHLDPPAPHVQMIDVHIQRPAVVHHDEPAPVPVPLPHTTATPTHRATHAVVAQPVAAVQPEVMPVAATVPGGDDGPVVAMPDVAPAATGVPVAKRPGTGKTGGGSGTGTGSGSGTGSGDAPVSVATIKHLAMPRADYGYVLSKEYPAEAKRLGIEGVLQVRLVVDASGKVTSATLLDHLGHGLDELALAQARTFEFTPARDGDDHPVASVVVWTFRMTPPR
jgi:TonB family protein